MLGSLYYDLCSIFCNLVPDRRKNLHTFSSTTITDTYEIYTAQFSDIIGALFNIVKLNFHQHFISAF